jgi:tellurite methyltransferase
LSSGHIEKWDQRYGAGEQLSRRPSPLVVESTRRLVPGPALDLACGPGRNALYLAEQGWRVTAVDGSAVAIGILRDLARERRLSIDARVADLEAGEFILENHAYILVLSCYYLQRSLIRGIKSSLQPGGLLIAITRIAGTEWPQGTATRAYPGELRELFGRWEILHYREDDPGESCDRAAVAELVARKPA